VATAIQELHWDSYTMAETVNIGTGKIELTIGHPTDMATQTWASTQLATKQNSITADLNVPGELTLSTSSATSGYGLPIWSFHGSITNYMAFGFTVTALGNNNQTEALTISRTGAVGIANDLVCQDVMAGCTTNTQYATATARINAVAGPNRNSAAHFINEQSGSQTCTFWNQATGSNVYLHEYVYGPNRTVIGSITTNGTSASYNTSSDGRLKTILNGAVKGLDVIQALQTKVFKWKGTDQEDEGLIAQDVAKVYPRAVSGSDDTQYMLDLSKFVIPLIRACQEQQAMMEALTQRVVALEAKKRKSKE